MIRVSNALFYSICRFKTAICSQCDIPLRGRPTISKYMSKRMNKRQTKYYCLPCALRLHVLTPQDAKEHGITVPPEESA